MERMIKLETTEATGLGYRHRTWTRMGDAPHKLSALQNQFALSEYGMSEEGAVQEFRGWLWQELQDPYNVVSTEMRTLVRAHKAGQAVEILVPQAAPHGEVIVRALLWLAKELHEGTTPAIRGSEPGPCYEPILPDGTITTRAEIDQQHLVWITGNTQSRIGVIVGYNEAFVPAYGIVPLKRFRWVNKKLASSPVLQRMLNDELDKAFEEEANQVPVEYDPAPFYTPENRFDYENPYWEQTEEEAIMQEAAFALAERDTLTLVEQLTNEIGDVETALAIAQMPEIEEWYYKRPPTPLDNLPEMMRPVYKYKDENSALMVKSVEEQLEDKRFHYATKEEAAEYICTFRS